jgi:hypothetical protein
MASSSSIRIPLRASRSLDKFPPITPHCDVSIAMSESTKPLAHGLVLQAALSEVGIGARISARDGRQNGGVELLVNPKPL